MKNSELPPNTALMTGSAPFANHPGFVADGCALREVVVARTGMTNNGFRCYATGGHCLPGEHCEKRRASVAQAEAQQSESVIVYDFPNGYEREAGVMFRRLQQMQFTPKWAFGESGETAIAIPMREVSQLEILKRNHPATY